VHIQCVAVNDVVGYRARLFDAVGVEFDAVSDGLLISSYYMEGAAIPDAGV
jgi:hypothetical protein